MLNQPSTDFQSIRIIRIFTYMLNGIWVGGYELIIVQKALVVNEISDGKEFQSSEFAKKSVNRLLLINALSMHAIALRYSADISFCDCV